LHFALGSPQVFRHIVFADSKHRRNFGKRVSLNFLQDKDIPAGGWKQEGPEHGQLERFFGIPARYDEGIATGNLFSALPTLTHHFTHSALRDIVRRWGIPFQTQGKNLEGKFLTRGNGRRVAVIRSSFRLPRPWTNDPLGIGPLWV